MYKCSVCNKGVIVTTEGEVIRACPVECANATILADATASMAGAGGVTQQ